MSLTSNTPLKTKKRRKAKIAAAMKMRCLNCGGTMWGSTVLSNGSICRDGCGMCYLWPVKK